MLSSKQDALWRQSRAKTDFANRANTDEAEGDHF